MSREHWGSRFGFIMATAGFAVGLGNIWRFPYVVGENGGGAFLIVYVAFAILIGIPLLTAEMSLGRKAQLSPIAGMAKLAGSAWSPWTLLGWMGVITAFLMSAYYIMLLAWIVGYLLMIVSGSMSVGSPQEIQASFDTFVARPGPVLAYDLVIVVLMAVLVGRGIKGGVERAGKIGMPVLFGMLLLLMVRSLTFEGAAEGVAWYLTPDFSKLTWGAVLAALGQAFYSIGIGMAGAFAFGSYLEPKTSALPGSAALIVGFDTGVAIIAGFVIFPALFAFGIAPDTGQSLLFVTLPNLFGQMPAGRLFGAGFFFLMLIAGVTSAMALLEALTASVSDSLGLERDKAVAAVATIWFLTSIPVVLSQGPWSHVTVGGRDIFAIVDYVTGTYTLPVGGLLVALYTAFAWGWQRFRDETNVGSGAVKVNATWKPFVLVIIPLAVAVVLVAGF